jgi:hypothetical protein
MCPTASRWTLGLSLALVLCTGLLVAVPSVAAALTPVTLYVNHSTGSGSVCSMASPCGNITQAVDDAQTYADSAVTIEVTAATYGEQVYIDMPSTDTLTILGAGSASTTLDYGGSGTDLTIQTGTFTMSGFTIEGGTATGGSEGGNVVNTDASAATLEDDTITGGTVSPRSGGDVYNSGGNLTLSDDTISGGMALSADGGDIYNVGTNLTLTDDTVSGGEAGIFGGAIYNSDSTVTITGSTISDSTASAASSGEGGGVYSIDSTLTLTGDTISGNTAKEFGGGSEFVSSPASMTNDTIAGNQQTSVTGEGGGIFNNASALTLTNDTIAGNSAGAAYGGAGLYEYTLSSSASLGNSILADNTPGGDCYGSLTISDNEYNVADDSTCELGGNSISSSSTIGSLSLAANGSSGPETEAITSTSSAFEEVPPANCSVNTDERGDPRPGASGEDCDAGAFEYQLAPTVPTVSKVSPNTGPTTGGTPITITGTGFVAGATVVVGQGSGSVTGVIPATGVKVVSSTEITAVTGGGAKAGTWAAFVGTLGGTSAGNPASDFTYKVVPTVSKVSPNTGPTTGGTPITITGTGFIAGATVVVGQGSGSVTGVIPATGVKVVSSTEITAVTGGGAKAGTWSLFVHTTGGTSAGGTASGFTYKVASVIPTVTKVSPNSGPTTGGTPITITGTGFIAGATVVIGQGSGSVTGVIPATSVVVVSSTEITAVTGGGAKAGTWALFVHTSGGTSAGNAGAAFTYG